MCVKCKKGHVSCQCSTTCKQCLTLGTLGDNGTCNCCKNCGAAQVTCEADGNCSEYKASGAVPQHPCSTPPPPVTTHAQQPTAFQQKPPDLNISEFCLALFWIVFSILYNGFDFEKVMKDLSMFDKNPDIIEDQNDLGKDTTVFKIDKDLHLIAKDQTYITEVYESNEQISDSTVFKTPPRILWVFGH